jgi:hypothetical protein
MQIDGERGALKGRVLDESEIFKMGHGSASGDVFLYYSMSASFPPRNI